MRALELTRRQVAAIYALGKAADRFTVQKLTTDGDVLVQAVGVNPARAWRVTLEGRSVKFPPEVAAYVA